jgi:hypothetical protein
MPLWIGHVLPSFAFLLGLPAHAIGGLAPSTCAPGRGPAFPHFLVKFVRLRAHLFWIHKKPQSDRALRPAEAVDHLGRPVTRGPRADGGRSR